MNFISRCKIKNCRQVNCYFFHHVKQQRRLQDTYNYKPIPCPNVFKEGYWERPDICPNSKNCEFAHTENEINYYIENYRKDLVDSGNLKHLEVFPLERNENDSYVNQLASFLGEINMLQSQVYQNELKLSEKIKEIEKIDKNIHLLNQKILCIGCKEQRYSIMLLPCRHMICSYCWNDNVCIRCGIRISCYIQIN
ncbi:hypothetical protein SteCoe_16094 [Stentor coeruleus]|uniref:C3H1-type domain-containing protein n=1 Tax=Stentor coeruleus TaxID=5963 RepID=A0A1R2C283_9CILI|nr:hypothetical protein SteCoe_16094 [Stentor coeruleus]